MRLLIQVWEEEGFAVPMRNLETERLLRMADPWELEAVGASDDASRFRVDAEAAEDEVAGLHY